MKGVIVIHLSFLRPIGRYENNLERHVARFDRLVTLGQNRRKLSAWGAPFSREIQPNIFPTQERFRFSFYHLRGSIIDFPVFVQYHLGQHFANLKGVA